MIEGLSVIHHKKEGGLHPPFLFFFVLCLFCVCFVFVLCLFCVCFVWCFGGFGFFFEGGGNVRENGFCFVCLFSLFLFLLACSSLVLIFSFSFDFCHKLPFFFYSGVTIHG